MTFTLFHQNQTLISSNDSAMGEEFTSIRKHQPKKPYNHSLVSKSSRRGMRPMRSSSSLSSNKRRNQSSIASSSPCTFYNIISTTNQFDFGPKKGSIIIILYIQKY